MNAWVTIAFGLLLVGAVIRMFVRLRLRRAGLTATRRLGTITSDIAECKLYHRVAPARGWSRLPLYLWIACLISSLTILIAYVGRRHFEHIQQRTTRQR